MTRVEAGINLHQPDKTLHQQSSADQQNEGKTDFRYNECGASPAVARRATTFAFLQRFVEIGTRGMKGRSEPKKNSTQDRNHKTEAKHLAIHADGGKSTDVMRTDGEERGNGPSCEQNPAAASRESEHDAFGQKLANQAQTASAQGRANGNFP